MVGASEDTNPVNETYNLLHDLTNISFASLKQIEQKHSAVQKEVYKAASGEKIYQVC